MAFRKKVNPLLKYKPDMMVIQESKIMSCYHKFYSEDFGSETRDSIFWRKNINTAYHIDYCIASDNLMQKMVKFELGTRYSGNC